MDGSKILDSFNELNRLYLILKNAKLAFDKNQCSELLSTVVFLHNWANKNFRVNLQASFDAQKALTLLSITHKSKSGKVREQAVTPILEVRRLFFQLLKDQAVTRRS